MGLGTAYERAFQGGRTFEEWVDEADDNRRMWRAMARRRFSVEPSADRIATLPGEWRLLALAEDWCGDAVNTIPVVARLAEAVGIELRIVPRDEHPELMDRHLTHGGRAIPVVILLDEDGESRGWWGPRPRALQEWFERHGRSMSATDRYRELRRRYARDRGVTTAAEIAELVACAASAGGSWEGTRPCDGSLAA